MVDRPTPAKDCLPGSVAGARRVLGSRRDRPAGESWAPSPPTDRQAVDVGTITRHFGIRLPRLQGPLQRPTTGSLTPPEQTAPRGAPPTPARAPPRSQPGSSCGPRPARAGRSGDAARRPASDPGRLKAPHARLRSCRRASGAAGSLRGRARGGSPRSTVAREEREHELGLHRGRRPRARRARGLGDERARCDPRADELGDLLGVPRCQATHDVRLARRRHDQPRAQQLAASRDVRTWS